MSGGAPRRIEVTREGLTSVSAGAATRMSRQRDLMGAMSRLVLFAQSTRRMFAVYFSIVRRSAACASRLSESASLMMTTARTRERFESAAVCYQARRPHL